MAGARRGAAGSAGVAGAGTVITISNTGRGFKLEQDYLAPVIQRSRGDSSPLRLLRMLRRETSHRAQPQPHSAGVTDIYCDRKEGT